MKTWTLNAIIKAVIAGLSLAATALFGGWGEALTILVILFAVDIASGVIRAIGQKELSSNLSWKGMGKKVLTLLIVALSAQLDNLLGSAPTLRDATVVFYCITEALSIVENAVAAGLPVPDAVMKVLKQSNEKKFID